MANTNDITFEAALAKLEAAAEALKKDSTTLDDSLNYFDEGLVQYNLCNEILAKARQKIQLYDEKTDSMKEME